MKKRIIGLLAACSLCVLGSLSSAAPQASLLSASAALSKVYAAAVNPTSPEAGPELAFPVLSDVHVQEWDKGSIRKFKNALNDLHAINPNADALVINGDLTGGMPRDYKRYADILENTPHPPVYHAIGNHEFYKAWLNADGGWAGESFPNGETEQASINRFLALNNQSKVYYDQWIKDYHFLFLGSEQYRQSDPNNAEDAYLSDEQLRWLEAKLQEKQDPSKPIFVFLHQPLPNTVAGSIDRGIVQHEQLKAILKKYPQVVFFSGHSHWQLEIPGSFVKDGFSMVNTSSVNEPFNENNEPVEVDISQGLYVEVFEDRVVIRGRSFDQRNWIPYSEYVIPRVVQHGQASQ
ncbi:hypothetical protein J31TS4_39740 [Paenibacillus sp. J31TS4]|uniref:metallophosphoesterase family protein n=1 Tax=Paenibacillus sp. J31TS4 TaxID=2807195 RepID=UPI001B083C49|nr:metallophosphoesterase [Paenibacillus sp. J31TS4]GIP40694.1 hypothetical protein J31TS4_39740 [Paenibacillus sp. J31TS4]